MADVRPLRAVHYDLDRVGSLDSVLAPPYDVIDPAMRTKLVGSSKHNAVAIDLPEADGDKYEHAAELFGTWRDDGVLVPDSGDAFWAIEQTYTGPDGQSRSRTGFLARIGVADYGSQGGVRPHERTQPGPKEDRLRLTRATKHNLSPIFVLSTGDAMGHLRSALDGEPWGTATDADGTINRIWRIDDPAAHEAVGAALADSELLIADGHHRYETARVYADEIGGDGPHRFTLAAVVALDDPGLEVFGYHRLLTDLSDPDIQEALGAAIMKHFDVQRIPLEQIDPAGEEGIGVFGYIDAHFRNAYRLWLKDPASVDALLPARSEAYRRLDAAILETLILREALGLSEADVEAKKGLAYSAQTAKAIESLGDGTDAAFLMRPTPVDQVRAVAAAGETMPPKSTYFYPKLPTGIVFNPLA